MSRSPSTSASLDDWLRWQERIHPAAIELGLERVREVARRLQLPQPGPRTVTVGGTNGKGSTSALLAGIYRAAGYRTGLYSSPHLLRYNERVSIDGQDADDEALCAAFAEVERARAATTLTYFEFGTLAALHLFRQAGVQVQVLEVGMGGRLDAVNLVDADCAVVTNIGLDHCEFLGRTRDAIAYEKAGIARPDRPVVCVDPDPPTRLGTELARIGARSLWLGRDFHYQSAGDNWNWHGPERAFKKLPAPAMAGAIQLRNAAGTLAAVNALQPVLPVSESALRSALVSVRLPGRFERRGNVVLDVAHNAEAAQVLAGQLRDAGLRRVRLVLGMLSDKPVEAFVQALAPHTLKVYTSSLPPPRGLDGAALLQRVQTAGLDASGHESPALAFAQARAECREGDTILVSGSFLTVAAVHPVQMDE